VGSNNQTFTGITASSDIDGNNNATNIGGDFYASHSANENIGIRGTIPGGQKPNSTNYAVYGEAGSVTNFWAGFFNGYIGTTAGWIQASDRRLKTEIKPMKANNSLDIIGKLKPTTYHFKNDENSTLNLPTEKQFGLIADEVELTLPELIRPMAIPAKYDIKGNMTEQAQTFKGVNYSAIIPILISAIQSLDSTNKLLQSQIQSLQTTCGYSFTAPTTLSNTSTTTLSDLTIILDQNTPNPFAEQTTITYTIPENIADAKIIFYTNNGTVIKTLPIIERGAGAVLIYASNLSSGLYSYTLIADGQVIATKKMVCNKGK
jgi:hypothetical protein